MKRISNLLILTTITSKAIAQGNEKALNSSYLSYFTAGFGLIFVAIFAFTFIFRLVANQRHKNKSTKQLFNASLRLALILSLVIIIALFMFLNS